MRIPARSLATTLLAVGVVSCSDSPIASVKQGPGPGHAGFARVGFAPVFSKAAQYAAQHADEYGVQFDSVRVVIRDTPDTSRVIADTAVVFGASSTALTLDMQVPVEVDGQRFDALVQYVGPSGVVQYSGHSIVQSYPVGGSVPAQTPITINFVGPGARAAKISVSPKTVSLVDGQTATFVVSAADSSGASMPAPPVAWTVSDTSGAVRISAAGVLTTTGRRAVVTVTVTSPTGLSDNASATITLPAAGIAVVSGAGQTGKVGAALANPAVVQVSASDGVGVAGVNVIFSAPTGAAVGVTSAVTDANGRASTTLRLGTAAGPQPFAATAAGFSVAIPITAVAGDPAAVAAVAGGGQTDTVLHALKQPLVVHVSDQFNNPVAGATVSWSRVGAGVLGASSSATNAEGNASISYTLGGIVGTETVSASVAGVSTPVSFALNAVAGVPAQLVMSPATPTSFNVVAGTTLANPPVVQTLDAAGNAVGGVAVHFAVTTVVKGTLTSVKDTTIATDAKGTLSVPAMPLTRAGPYTVAITSGAIANASISLTLSILPGQATQLTTPNGNMIVNAIGAAAVYPSFALLDAYNNPVPNQSLTLSTTSLCSINSGLAPRATDSTGTLAFAAASLALPLGKPGSCRITATTGTMKATVNMIAVPKSFAAWTGSSNSDWGNAANWAANVVPASRDSVYIPLYARVAAALSADQSVASILVDDTAAVNLGGHTLTSYGYVDANSSGSLFGGTLVVTANGGGGSYLRGMLPTTTCTNSGHYQLAGATHFGGSLVLDSCALSINANTARVDSNFTTLNSASLAMDSTSDVLYIGGNALFSGSSGVNLTNGRIIVAGNFRQAGSGGNFSASGSNSVYMTGTRPDTISFQTTGGAQFQNLYLVDSAQTDSVHITAPIKVNGTMGVFAAVPVTFEDTTTVTAGSLQLGKGAKMVLNTRARVSPNSCAMYADGSNNAVIVGTNQSAIATLLNVIPPLLQPLCTQTTTIPLPL